MEASELKTGDLIFFKSKGFLPLAIRAIADIKYNHVGVCILNWHQPFVNEALGRGILAQPVADRLKGKNILIRRPDFHIDEEQFAKDANKFLGKRYDFKGLFINQLILQLFGVWNGGDATKEANRFYCYEYVCFLNQNIFPEWWKVNPREVLHSSRFTDIFKGVWN